jgi:uncharacterized protein (DUF427 family)
MSDTAPNGKPFESVWDYPRPPRLERVDHLVEVVHNGVTVVSSTACFRILETSQPPAYYVPASDVATELLRPSAARSTFCEWKGLASYADVGPPDGADGSVAVGAAWTYPEPSASFAAIVDHWAFYAQKLDACFVDGEAVAANEGSFYGGWITSNITGPFKGAPGTSHW